MLIRLHGSLLIIAFCTVPSIAGGRPANEDSDRPLKVYILAGQSNMVGAAHVRTLTHIGDDPATKPILEEMRDADGAHRFVKDTWISNFQGQEVGDPSGEGFGQLIAGYGARRDATKVGEKIGPELTFGIYMQKALKEPILIIKTAWGGKSIYQDFRPPSAGPYKLNASEVEGLKRGGRDVDAEQAKRTKASGVYYRLMLGHIEHVLRDIKRVYPDYDAERGYEIAGFVWFQGWNDLVNRGVYPRRGEPGGYDEYSKVLATFIRDIRRDLKTPKMPFIIGVMGTNGPIDNLEKRYRGIHQNFRTAMAAPAALPEFQGNVLAVQTYPHWDLQIDALIKKRNSYNGKKRAIQNRVKKKELAEEEARKELAKIADDAPTEEEQATLKRGASDAAYHYLGSAKTMALIGKAFADGLLELQSK